MAYNDTRDYNGAHTIEYYQQYESTIADGEARIPICVCVDTSESMSCLINPPSELIIEESSLRSVDGNRVRTARARHDSIKLTSRIDKLKDVLGEMIYKMRSSDLLQRAAVMSIVTFDKFPNCVCEFSNLSNISVNTTQNIKLGRDVTNLGRGLRMALDRLDRQVALGNDAGNDSYSPVLVVMTDGTPTDSAEAEKMVAEVHRRVLNHALKVIPIAIGVNRYDEARLSWLKRMTPDNRVYHMNSREEFDEMFAAITARINQTSRVIAVDDYDMDPSDSNNAGDVDSQASEQSTQYGAEASDQIMRDFFGL